VTALVEREEELKQDLKTAKTLKKTTTESVHNMEILGSLLKQIEDLGWKLSRVK
jgi:hypothetical protein